MIWVILFAGLKYALDQSGASAVSFGFAQTDTNTAAVLGTVFSYVMTKIYSWLFGRPSVRGVLKEIARVETDITSLGYEISMQEVRSLILKDLKNEAVATANSGNNVLGWLFSLYSSAVANTNTRTNTRTNTGS